MRLLRRSYARVWNFITGRRADERLREEMEAHLALQTEENLRSGMPPDQARREARLKFGAVEAVREHYHAEEGLPFLENLLLDFRYALRQLRKSPGFTLTALLTLALGMGLNAALFTVFNKALLHTLPVPHPGELVLLEEHSNLETGSLFTVGGGENIYFAYPAYQQMRDHNHVLDGLAAAAIGSGNFVSSKEADRVNMDLVTGNYFQVMGVHPVLGRLLTPADDRFHAGNRVAVLSEGYWKAHLGRDPGILNRVVQVNGVELTIVGVVRHQGLWDGDDPGIFLPIALEQEITPGHEDRLTNSLFRWLVLTGRLHPGETRKQAEAELNTLWWNWRRDVAETRSDQILPSARIDWLKTHLSVRNGARGVQTLRESLGEPLKVLEAMALLVLLIACANVANLLLVKTARKQSELAVRGALGASRSRIFQQVITEGFLLGILGAFAGLTLGTISLQLLVKSIPQSNGLHDMLQAPLDGKVVVFGVIAGLATSLFFSVAPGLLSARIELLRALHGQSGTATARGGWLRNLLVSGEIALSFTLLTGAAILSWNLYELRNVNPGYATSHLLTFRIDASSSRKGNAPKDEYDAIRDGILHLPGVRSVVYAGNGLLTGEDSGNDITVSGYLNKKNEPMSLNDWITPGFFSTMQIPLMAGREFAADDTATSPKVAIVDETFVNHYFGGDLGEALRRQFGFGFGDIRTDIQIVGVVHSIHNAKLADSNGLPFIYLPFAQTDGGHKASYYVSTYGGPARLAGSVRAVLRRVDRNLPIPDMETMQEHVNGLMFQTQLMTTLACSMGGLALVLAAIGLYGMLAFTVSGRTREFGIRIAMGAGRSNISTVVLRHVGVLVAIGVAAGTGLAWAVLRFLNSEVSDLHSAPFLLYVLVGLALVVAMLAAGYLPARRSATIDPIEALRSE
jgi:putative ABC transport system permease protein